MGPGKYYDNVGKSQSVLMMINPMISPRTRKMAARGRCRRGAALPGAVSSRLERYASGREARLGLLTPEGELAMPGGGVDSRHQPPGGEAEMEGLRREVAALQMAAARGESFMRVHWVAVPKELRARRVNRHGPGCGRPPPRAAHGASTGRLPLPPPCFPTWQRNGCGVVGWGEGPLQRAEIDYREIDYRGCSARAPPTLRSARAIPRWRGVRPLRGVRRRRRAMRRGRRGGRSAPRRCRRRTRRRWRRR
jgi:hypothetical protein